MSPLSDDGAGVSRTRWALLAAVVLLAVPLAGCATDGGTGDSSEVGASKDQGMTAKSGLEAANEEAKAWANDPDLVEAASLESTEGVPASAPEGIDWGPDGTFGDGRAYAWKYTFASDGERKNFYVNVNGNTTSNDKVRTQADQPIDSWKVSSEDAVAKAKENESVSSTLEADDAQIILALGADQDGPGWVIQIRSESMGEQHLVTVDANTGEMQTR